MSEENNKSLLKHWPTVLLGLMVTVVFLFSIFSFQVKSTEYVIVSTLGKISEIKDAGLHFCWPYPIQKIYRFDNRLYCFDGSVGKIEETYTRDGKNITIGIFVVYKIANPEKLFRSFSQNTIPEAENKLNNLMRTVKDSVIGKYKVDELVNTDPKKMKLDSVEAEIMTGLEGKVLSQYGIKIESAGIKSLGIPEKNSEKVFERMKSERNVVAENYRQEGKSQAKIIRDDADNTRKLKLAEAEAKAKQIRAEGDAKSASFYSIFKEEPELAAFLRKLESLKKILPSRTTLILNTNYPPFDLLNLDVNSFGKLKSDEVDVIKKDLK